MIGWVQGEMGGLMDMVVFLVVFGCRGDHSAGNVVFAEVLTLPNGMSKGCGYVTVHLADSDAFLCIGDG